MHLDAILGSNLASKCPSRVPRITNFARQYGTFCTFSEIAFCALQVLLGCLLAALGAILGAFWVPLGASGASIELNLGPLGRLWGSSWGLLGGSWAPLGRLGRLLGQLGAFRAPNGRQVDAKWASNWAARTAARVSIRLKNAKTAAKSHRTPRQQYFCRCIATGVR